MATVCSNCGTTQGPFVRDAATPGKPLCGIPSRTKDRMRRAGSKREDIEALELSTLKGCAERRRALDERKGGPATR